MIQSFQVPEHDIAFYSGALIAVFTFGEFLSGVVWARISDRIGRKPTVLIGSSAVSFRLLPLGCRGLLLLPLLPARPAVYSTQTSDLSRHALGNWRGKSSEVSKRLDSAG
jgi:MFS family permease